MVEQWTHKPLDVGSNPTLATQLLTFLIVCTNTRQGTWSHARHSIINLFHCVFKYPPGYTSHPRHSIINLSLCVFKYPSGYMSHPRHLIINLFHCVFKYPSGYTSHPRYSLFQIQKTSY